LPCGNINPLGITGTPVIDPSTQAIYFDAAVERANGPRQEVFGLSLRDGTVLSIGHRSELEAFHGRKIVLKRVRGGAKFVSDIYLFPKRVSRGARSGTGLHSDPHRARPEVAREWLRQSEIGLVIVIMTSKTNIEYEIGVRNRTGRRGCRQYPLPASAIRAEIEHHGGSPARWENRVAWSVNGCPALEP
jgi:hypothetical protein